MAVYKIKGEIEFPDKLIPNYDIENILCFMSEMVCDEYKEAYINLEVYEEKLYEE